jgi:mannose-6-phosphate isomerase-like protein (cupin superfamily)
MAPGEATKAVRLERAREEWYFVLSGTIRVTLTDDETFVLSEGDSIHIESSRLDEISNPSEDTSTFISMMTPPQL